MKTIYMKLEKETKGAVRYQEVDSKGEKLSNYAIGTLYIRKSALTTPYPTSLTVTILEGGEDK